MTPSRARHTISPAKLFTNTMQVVTIPHDTTMREIHLDGVAFFSIRLLGTSKITYLTKEKEKREKRESH